MTKARQSGLLKGEQKIAVEKQFPKPQHTPRIRLRRSKAWSPSGGGRVSGAGGLLLDRLDLNGQLGVVGRA
ncbi:MAG: hypothetical protein WEK74_01660, partial [Hydrogenophaga sp.]